MHDSKIIIQNSAYTKQLCFIYVLGSLYTSHAYGRILNWTKALSEIYFFSSESTNGNSLLYVNTSYVISKGNNVYHLFLKLCQIEKL
jgi:hypothetical protein